SPRSGDAVVQGDFGLPAELAPGAARVDHRADDVAEPRLAVRGLFADPRGAAACGVQLVDARRNPGADVVRAAAPSHGREQRGDDVADVDEIALLLPVAEDDCFLAARHALEEDRDDAAFEARGLPR